MEKKKHLVRLENKSLSADQLSRSQFRLLGFLPLAFFTAQAIHYWQINELGHMFWMCNIGNLLLAIGLFLENAPLIRVATIWAVPGLIVWFVYVVPTWGMLLTGKYNYMQLFGVISSTLAHVGGISVGIVAMRRVGMDGRGWFYAFIWYFVVQLLSRLLTPVAMNVNLSQRIQDGWEGVFSTYWRFWLVLSLIVGICSWVLGFILKTLWPASTEAPAVRGLT